MYREIAQWTMVRRRVLEEGVSRKQLSRETGICRNTIRKMLRHKTPPPCPLKVVRYPRLGAYTKTLDELAALNDAAPLKDRMSVSDIYGHLQKTENYSGCYNTVLDYLKFRGSARTKTDAKAWRSIYETIISLKARDSIALLQALSFNGKPLISLAGLRDFQFATEKLRCLETQSPRQARTAEDREWIRRVLSRDIPLNDLRDQYKEIENFETFSARLYGAKKTLRNRATVVLAHLHGISDHVIASALGISRLTVRRSRRLFRAEGVAGLFASKRRTGIKIDDEELKTAIFSILHEPPSNYGINRTTWTMRHLCDVLAKHGKATCQHVVVAITKAAGYKWRKARVVLTSNDPDYAEKVARIQSILSGLQQDEAFFSIDEFGPFAVKAKAGRSLTAPGEQRQVQQWQKSKGCLILTAAIELSSNQVTHFYSLKKNTAEMIRMLELLLQRYKDKKKLYLSWDAASWHISKKLFERIESNNKMVFVTDTGPIVETVPLPARAQFLNVIESIFSGMARAIIHNSDYGSVDEAKAAIDRYFDERNCQFRAHPRRAGKKIWGKERVPPLFSPSNNCKDPRYR